MSETWMSLPQLVKLIRSKYDLTKNQIILLLLWYRICGERGFGFQDTVGIEAQLDCAVNYLLEKERKWNSDVIDNVTDKAFVQFLYEESFNEGIIFDLLKEVDDELDGT